MAHHRDPLETHAEGEAGDLLRVVADRAEDVRVHHARAAGPHPAWTLAHRTTAGLAPPPQAARAAADDARDGHLASGLDEGEIDRDQAGPRLLPVDRARERVERALEVGH